eukprot:TRINITY_DN1696_c0_g1_i4.p4 TRINITY_DN1696_c0_g1~~TRINITY_DN1696_c0_g1_i4.p4  ORF type:complete len:143 (-),score=36.19 TRINITY_DN1696_c0_g1_i4:174-602(-)
MQLPAHITALSIRDASPVVLTHMLDIATLTALESLYISGWDVWGEGDGQDEQWAAVTQLLPASIKKLLLGNHVGGILTIGALPPALEELRVDADSNFNAPLTQFPPTLRVLQLNESFDAPSLTAFKWRSCRSASAHWCALAC